MNSFVKKYAGIALASIVVIGGIASAAITPIPTISNTFAVAGQKILSADINKLAEALNVLDARTNPQWVSMDLADTTTKFDPACIYEGMFETTPIYFNAGNPNFLTVSYHYNNSITVRTIEFNAKGTVNAVDINTGGTGIAHSTTITSLKKKCWQ